MDNEQRISIPSSDSPLQFWQRYIAKYQLQTYGRTTTLAPVVVRLNQRD